MRTKLCQTFECAVDAPLSYNAMHNGNERSVGEKNLMNSVE